MHVVNCGPVASLTGIRDSCDMAEGTVLTGINPLFVLYAICGLTVAFSCCRDFPFPLIDNRLPAGAISFKQLINGRFREILWNSPEP